VPLFDRSRPYQQIPFQYSLHFLEREDAELVHFEFLADAGPDPRPYFYEKLIKDIGHSGDIVVYNEAFEKFILRQLFRDFPSFTPQLEGIIWRIRDLMGPFQKRHIYTPEMRGSYSIKSILPAIVPGFGYDSLAIAEGSSASLAFQKMFNEEDEENIRQTKAVVEMTQKFGEHISVEGELGFLAGASKMINEKIDIKEEYYTDPAQANDFVERTGVDRMAIIVGSIHGIAVNTPHLDIERLKEAYKLLKGKAVLVLHGGSGIPDAQIKDAILNGIRKINVNTELRIAFEGALQKELDETDQTQSNQ